MGQHGLSTRTNSFDGSLAVLNESRLSTGTSKTSRTNPKVNLTCQPSHTVTCTDITWSECETTTRNPEETDRQPRKSGRNADLRVLNVCHTLICHPWRSGPISRRFTLQDDNDEHKPINQYNQMEAYSTSNPPPISKLL